MSQRNDPCYQLRELEWHIRKAKEQWPWIILGASIYALAILLAFALDT